MHCAGSTLDMSFKLLHEAQSKLKNIIHNRFDSAVRSGDVASVERFFKTFPLIGEHKAGLEKFSKYLCTQVSHVYGDGVVVAFCCCSCCCRYQYNLADKLIFATTFTDEKFYLSELVNLLFL